MIHANIGLNKFFPLHIFCLVVLSPPAVTLQPCPTVRNTAVRKMKHLKNCILILMPSFPQRFHSKDAFSTVKIIPNLTEIFLLVFYLKSVCYFLLFSTFSLL